jgi:hypothetical protein
LIFGDGVALEKSATLPSVVFLFCSNTRDRSISTHSASKPGLLKRRQ